MRKCYRCMKDYREDQGYKNNQYICPYCGFVDGTPPKELNHLSPGTILENRYGMGVVLGFGGFGITYKAWDFQLNTVVAIKEYYPSALVQRVPGQKDVIMYEGSKRQEFLSGLDRFLEEARSMSKFVNHPNIVRVDNYFEANHTAYIVMEFLDGISLKEFLKQEHGKIDYSMAIDIADCIINALDEIHKAGILHRDISPDNIFLCEGGVVKLLDFGAARFSDEEKEVTRSVILKPGFAPPEQYQSKSKQGPWTDIYALSATLYRAITGKLPDESVNRAVEDELHAPIEIDNQIPEYLSNTIMKGMALNPDLRFRNVEEFRKALKNQTKVEDLKVELKKRKRKRVLGIAVVALILVMGGLVAFNIFRRKKAQVDLESATITIWIAVDEDEDAEEQQQMMKNIVSKFKEDQPSINIEIEAVASGEYAKKLEEADASSSMPTLYESYYASDEILHDAASVEHVYEYIDDLENYYFFGEYKKEIVSAKQIPMGFNVPVVYVRTGKNDNTGGITIESYDDISACGVVNERYADTFLSSFGGNTGTYTMVVCDEDTAMEGFAEGSILYYMATVREFPDFNSNIDVAGLYQLYPLDTDIVYGAFTDAWSISGDAKGEEVIAAQVLLSYMLAERPQRIMYVTHRNTLPLNKKTYEILISNNGDFKVVNTYLDKLELDFEKTQ